MKITRYKRSRIYQHAGWLHGDKHGAPVLKDQSSWRTVSGFFVNTDRTGMVCVEWRHS